MHNPCPFSSPTQVPSSPSCSWLQLLLEEQSSPAASLPLLGADFCITCQQNQMWVQKSCSHSFLRRAFGKSGGHIRWTRVLVGATTAGLRNTESYPGHCPSLTWFPPDYFPILPQSMGLIFLNLWVTRHEPERRGSVRRLLESLRWEMGWFHNLKVSLSGLIGFELMALCC
jgi:hypothetical protein